MYAPHADVEAVCNLSYAEPAFKLKAQHFFDFPHGYALPGHTDLLGRLAVQRSMALQVVIARCCFSPLEGCSN